MRVAFSPRAWADYLWWQDQDRRTLRRINRLIEDIARNGDQGIGKPEILKGDLQGFRSRRITDEHRLVYEIVDDDLLNIAACRYHYE